MPENDSSKPPKKRPRGRPPAAASASRANLAAVAEKKVLLGPGPGRKKCENCAAYQPARQKTCSNCTYPLNFYIFFNSLKLIFTRWKRFHVEEEDSDQSAL